MFLPWRDSLSALVVSGTQSVKPNGQIQLVCNATSTQRQPVTSLDWYKNGRRLEGNSRNVILRNYGRDRYYVSELYVRRAGVTDGGRYLCRSQRNQESIDVRVEGMCSLAIMYNFLFRLQTFSLVNTLSLTARFLFGDNM